MAAKKGGKKALGRGLDALFGEVSVDSSANREKTKNSPSKGKTILSGEKLEKDTESVDRDVIYVPVSEIKPNSAQPRRHFSEESLEGLASSIEKHGLIQPVMVKPSKYGYELVAGERRWRAARRAGFKEIPAIIREVSSEENALFALIENVQREDLNPMEEAQAYRHIMDDYGLTQEDVAKSVGKSRPYVANTLRLLKLPEKIRGYLSEGKLSAGHANAIGSVSGSESRQKLADRIVKEGLSVREAEALAQMLEKKGSEIKKSRKTPPKNPEIMMIEAELTTLFGTKVTLGKNINRGIVEIHYYSKEELDGLIEEFMRIRQ
ncbi:MAG: ParB/RepB/Spo0J family partition protein [Clostridiales Family XIII bacterium]|jgi:ParB family chromosome partitioning protein|nr:ParB/RepB/Spo0J family partition protein [Clostridiales Family XIII bacterium]